MENEPHTFDRLAHSPLLIKTHIKSGMGLKRNLSPTFDMLVDKYFEIEDKEDKNRVIVDLMEGKIAM